jgi:hypothetical protein
MKYITILKNSFFQKQPAVLLGRWNIVYCEKKINKKVDLANEDNCGVCDKIKYNNNFINIKKINLWLFYEHM